MKTSVMLLACLLCLSATPAYALRCGARLVSPGDAKAEVWRKCGEPEAADWHVVYRPISVGAPSRYDPFAPSSEVTYVPVVIEVWIYNFGPRRFRQELSFEAGRLIAIRSLGYGD